MRFLVLSLFTVLAFSSPVAAGPMTYAGSESADFINPVGGTSSDGGNHTLFLGTNNHAGIRWAGGISFSATQGVPIDLGDIYLWNGKPTNIPSQVTWRVNLNFSQPNTGLASFDFATPLSYNPTNQTLSATFTPGETASFTAANGTRYQLEIIGLADSIGAIGNINSTLVSQQSQENSTDVWGRLTSVDPAPQVPEPSALALGAIGLALAGFRRLRLCAQR